MAKKEQKIQVRTIFRLGDFNDDEVNNDPSMTDPSQDEPIERLVERMLRGEIVGNGVPQYDTSADLSPEQIFALQSEVKKDGFDLADAPRIVKKAQEGLSGLPKAHALPPVPEKVEKPQEEAPKPPNDAVK